MIGLEHAEGEKKVNFKEAFEKASEKKEVGELDYSKEYELTAAMAILKPNIYITHEWILMYYNKKENKTTQVVVTDEEVTVKNPEKPLKPSIKPLDLRKIKTNSDKMLEKSRKNFEQYKKPLSQLIINLTQEKQPVWRFSFITKTLEVVTIEINAETGEVIGKKIQALTK